MLGNRSWKPAVLGLPFLLLASVAVFAQQPQVSDPTRNLTPVTDAMLLNPPDGDWLMFRRTYNGYGYSPCTTASSTSSISPTRCRRSTALPAT
jgi:hypothetical protein